MNSDGYPQGRRTGKIAHVSKETEYHWQEGQWYPVGDYEVCVTGTTMHGFLVKQRPYVDIPDPVGVEYELQDGKPSEPNSNCGD